MLEIVEVAPRDGLQNERNHLAAALKAELVLRTVAAGARRIEAVSFVSPRAVPQLADAEQVLAALRERADLRAQGVVLSSLILNRRGLDRALAAGIDEVNFVVMASESFNQRNQGAPIAETMRQLADSAALARREGLRFTASIGAAFGCPYQGEVAEADVAALARELAALDIAEIALADTIGVADPVAVERRVAALREIAPMARIRCHFHNTRNTGIANAVAAWRSGAHSIDASLGGIGGCPFAPAATGNIATEDTVYLFERMQVPTGYDLAALIDASRWLAAQLGADRLPGMLARSGGFPAATDAA